MADHEPAVGAAGVPAVAPTAYHYGYRPSIQWRRLHCVLPGALLSEHEGHPAGSSWCDAVAYLDDGPPGLDWARWPACLTCAPAYDRHLIMEALGAGPADGLHAQQVVEQLPHVAVQARLLNLVDEGFVMRRRDHGDDQYTYQLTGSGASAWYRRQP